MRGKGQMKIDNKKNKTGFFLCCALLFVILKAEILIPVLNRNLRRSRIKSAMRSLGVMREKGERKERVSERGRIEKNGTRGICIHIDQQIQ